MSFQVTENFVQQFSANFHILSQQMQSRFQPFVQVESGIVGASKATERLGATDAYDITSRHGDTEYVETPHSRRWLDLQDKGWAELVDEMDKIKMLADPTSPYAKLGVAALSRAKDDVIIAAALGTARTGTGVQALPAAQKIAAAGAGLTLAKLLAAKEAMDAAEVDEPMMGQDGQGVATPQRCIAVSSRQLTNLLGTTEIKSIDYNNVKTLVNGQVDTFLGFKFIRTERLPLVGANRSCVAWSKGCVGLGIGKDIVSSIDTLPTKNMSVQVYARESIAAVRLEDDGVIEVACQEQAVNSRHGRYLVAMLVNVTKGQFI